MDGAIGELRHFLDDPAPFYWWMILGEAGVNITLAYLATGTRLVFAAEDFDEARAALE